MQGFVRRIEEEVPGGKRRARRHVRRSLRLVLRSKGHPGSGLQQVGLHEQLQAKPEV